MFFYLTPLAYCSVPSPREKRWGMNVLLAYGTVLGGNRLGIQCGCPIDWAHFLLGEWLWNNFLWLALDHTIGNVKTFFLFKWSKMINPVENCQAAVRSPFHHFHHFLYSLDSCWLPQSWKKIVGHARANVCVGVCWGEGNWQNWCPLSVRLLVFLRLGDNLLLSV